jgi:hypothetical protein
MNLSVDIIQNIGNYMQIEEFMKLAKEYNLSWIIYCKNINFMNIHSYKKYGRGNLLDWAIKNNYLGVIQYINNLDNICKSCIKLDLTNVEKDVYNYIYDIHGPCKKCYYWALNMASSNGHLNIIKYLNMDCLKCKNKLLEIIKKNNHKDVINYIKYNIG